MFGAALDALDMPEKIVLKRAYVESAQGDSSQRFPADPYEVIKGTVNDPAILEHGLERLVADPILTSIEGLIWKKI